MKRVLSILVGIMFLVGIAYFSQDRMALDVQKYGDKQLQTQYKFSDDNYLVTILQGAQNITYTLDEHNKRTSKIVNGKVEEKYLWQGEEKLFIVTDNKDKVLREYLYKTKYDLLPYGMKSNNQSYRFIYNKMRTLRVVLNSKNQIVKVLDYDTNGKVIKDTNPNLKVDFSYASGLLESNSGVLFFPEGMYHTFNGEWISKIKSDDIIQNLKQLTKLPKNKVYQCSDTLDTYYHSYLCTNGDCSGLYAIDYLNYFNGRGIMGDNSKYFNSKRCEVVSLSDRLYDNKKFSLCVEEKIKSKEIKTFDAISHNCHHEIDQIVTSCKNISKKGNS